MGLTRLEHGSNPARNVRMQWSNTKQTGIPYVPVWARNCLCFEPGSSRIKYCVQESLKSLKSLTWIFGLNRSNPARIPLETQTKMYVRLRGSRGSPSIGTNYESHLEHMEQPFDMFYSIAFERFELGSSLVRVVSNIFKGISSLTQYLILVESGSKHKQITIPIWNIWNVYGFHMVHMKHPLD